MSIPQAAIVINPRDYVPETQWDDGITALLLNYSVNGASTRARDRSGTDSTTQYANLRPGMNIGPRRLRNYTTFQRDNNGRDSWDTVYTYLSRDIRVLKSQLVLGDSASRPIFSTAFLSRRAVGVRRGDDPRQHEGLCTGDQRHCANQRAGDYPAERVCYLSELCGTGRI